MRAQFRAARYGPPRRHWQHPDGRLTADELANLIPGVEHYAEVETEQFENLPNSSLTVEGSVFDTQSARRTTGS